MLKYSIKRLARSLITLIILITIVFALLRFMPEEGYFNNYEKMSPAQIELGLIKMGLKDPLYSSDRMSRRRTRFSSACSRRRVASPRR